MRILHVTHEFPPYEFAGTAIYTYNIVKALSKNNDVLVLSRLEDQNVAPYEVIDEDRGSYRVRLLSRPHLDWDPFEHSYTDEKAEAVFRATLDEFEPDVVHFQHLLGFSYTCIAEVKKRGLGVVMTLHDFWTMCPMGQRMCYTDRELCEEIDFNKCGPCVFGDGWSFEQRPVEETSAPRSLFGRLFDERFKTTPGKFARRPRAAAWAALKTVGTRTGFSSAPAKPDALTPHPFAVRSERMREALSHCDLLITPSGFLRDEFVRLFHVDPGRIIHSPNGMTFDHVVAHPKTASDIVRFGFVGSIIPTKGVHVLVEAAKKLDDLSGFCVDIHGAPNRWTKDYDAECRKAGEGCDAVRFHGRFDNKRIGEVLAKIDVLVVPSIWYENAPLTLNEAAMTETPVLASDKGGMLEFVRDNDYGRCFRLGDPEDLAKEMRRLIEDPSLIPQLVGRKPVIKPVDDNAAALLGYYERVARGKHPLERQESVL